VYNFDTINLKLNKMKSYISLSKWSFILVGAIFLLSSCNKWHYNHPRVKVDLDQPNEVNEATAFPQQRSVTTEVPENDGMTVIQPSTTEVASVEKESKNTPVSTPHQSPIKHKKEGPVKHKKESKSPFSFIKKLNNGEHLFKVNEVEKADLSGWVRIMVILFVVGFIMVIIGIFLSVFLYPGFWWLFYFFGSLCILAGFIVLILGLVGVMA
jgi:hypothetical protein